MNDVSPRIAPLAEPATIDGAPRPTSDIETFLVVYRAHFAFVWRNVRRLGVTTEAVDDVVQEIFLVVHRRLCTFQGRSSMRTWLFGITRRVVADHRKSRRRKPATPTEPAALDAVAPSECQFARIEAFELVCALLDTLDEVKREAFVLAELEGMTMLETAEATSTNPNTVAARLRAARAAFEQALAEHDSADRILHEGPRR